jgi:hypothetical protein
VENDGNLVASGRLAVMDFIESDIMEALEKITAKAKAEKWNGDIPWTKAVLKGIVDVGQANGYSTAADKNKCVSDNDGEWLYDVVWFQYDKAVYLTDVALVA